MSLILDVSRRQEQLLASLYMPGATVQSQEAVVLEWKTINQASRRIVDLIERNCLLREFSPGSLSELKKNGQLLFDYLIPSKIKTQFDAAEVADLTFLIDEPLVFIPWELLYDGEDFFCRKFNTGRCVRTGRPMDMGGGSLTRSPLRMLIIADPQGNLPSARSEAVLIRDKLAGSPEIAVTTKTKNVYGHFLQKNIREYDILHYAGHADFDIQGPENSGLILRDGTLTCQDLSKLGSSSPLPQLIFMNACRSMLSLHEPHVDQFEQGLFGLANTFLMAGGRYVIGTLARVPDDSAAEMARHFYHYFAERKSVGLALRMARQELSARSGGNDLAWAGYVLYGEPAGTIFTPSTKDLAAVDHPVGVIKRHVPLIRKMGPVFIFAIIGLLFISVHHWALVIQRRIAIQHYSSGNYALAYSVLKKTVSIPWQSSQQRLTLYEWLGNTASLARSYEQSDDWFNKAMILADNHSLYRTGVRLTLARAENILQANRYSRSLHQDKIAVKLSLSEARQLYETAEQFARKNNDLGSMAEARAGLGKIFQFQEDWGSAVSQYQSAVINWGKIKQLTVPETLQLSGVYLDLAGLYIYPQLRFNEAKGCLDQFDQRMRSLAALTSTEDGMSSKKDSALIQKEYRKSLKILMRRFEYLMFELARKGYKHSDLYQKAGHIFDNLYPLMMKD